MSVLERPQRTSLRREPAFRNARKTPKFQRLNGWDTTFLNDPIDIVVWSNLQGLIHAKKDCKKLKLTEEDLQFRHEPKTRCNALDDQHTFEKHSLHKHLHMREKEENAKPKRSRTSVNLQTSTKPNVSLHHSHSVAQTIAPAPSLSVTTTKPFTFRTEKLRENRRQEEQKRKKISSFLRSKTQDDMRLFLHSEDYLQQNLIQKCFPSKRCRSVPIQEAIDLSGLSPNQRPSSFRRLMYYVRRYESRDDIVHDEEEEDDEGYGSKTPSNDEKEMAMLHNEALNMEGISCISGKSAQSKNKLKLAKFSYTHQLAKAQLYEESEDEKLINSAACDSPIKYYKTGYVDTKGNEFVKRMLDRSYTSVGTNFESTHVYRLDGVKPPVLMRKISIQDPVGEIGSYATRSRTPNDQVDMYEPQRTIVRHNSMIQSDRTQYPVFCTTPELQFNTTPIPTSRPSSTARDCSSAKRISSGNSVKRSSHVKPNAKPSSELLRRTRNNTFELYRSHTSVCMPLGDLLPAVDRSIKSKSKSRPGYPVAQSMQEFPSSVLSPRTSEEPSPSPSDVLNSSKSTTPRRISSDAMTPEQIQKKQYSLLNTSLNQGSPRDPRTRFTSTKLQDKQGNHLHLSLLGLDIVLRNETRQSNLPLRQRTFGKVRFTSNPDKGTKKKLRDAFSRFYSKQPYDSNVDKRSWSEELKFVWNM